MKWLNVVVVENIKNITGSKIQEYNLFTTT